MFKNDLCIIGGFGHVGLPLGIVFADKGLSVVLLDKDAQKKEMIQSGQMPFVEYDSEPILKKVIQNEKLKLSLDENIISSCKYVLIAIGTPIDEYLNPKTRQFLEFIKSIKKHLTKDQTLIIRSSIYPNTSRQVINILQGTIDCIAYCPERIVQGFAVKELGQLPQIIAGADDASFESAKTLFEKISPQIFRTTLEEAELVKLFSNAWRYIQFASTNQFYMICDKLGVDYDKVRSAMKDSYPRAANIPGPGFAAGPCLLKDTMQLASFGAVSFPLGSAAMTVNEGLPAFIVEKIRARYDIASKKIGILGMAFKADVDDIRDSLSYKLGKILRFYGADVYYSDEFAQDPTFISKEQMISTCDIIIVGAPHSAYKGVNIPDRVEVVDLWNCVNSSNKI